MLDCVVFGRVAGKHCAKYMLGDKFKSMDPWLKVIATVHTCST